MPLGVLISWHVNPEAADAVRRYSLLASSRPFLPTRVTASRVPASLTRMAAMRRPWRLQQARQRLALGR